MGAFDKLAETLKSAVLLESRVNRLDDEIKRQLSVGMDHEKRLVRIETIIEIGQRGGLAPRIED